MGTERGTLTPERKERLALALVEALNTALDHGLEHDDVTHHLAHFQRELLGAFDEGGERTVELEMASSLFMHSGSRLVSASIRGRRQIEALRCSSAGGFEFDVDTSEVDLRRLIQFSVEARGTIRALDDARDALANQGVASVRLLAASDSYDWAPIRAKATRSMYARAGFELDIATPVYRSLAMSVEDAVERAQKGSAVDMNATRSIGEQLSRMTGARFTDLLHLVERPDFDLYTVQHSLRVALLGTYVATCLGATPNAVTEIATAALLHDVGKGRIPREILEKPGRLDEEERRVMGQHPQLGAEILLDSDDVGPCALGAAFGHHLRFDGRGYPETRSWFRRGRITNLLQVCDVFEALTGRRPYEEPYTPARAYTLLYSDPGAFDPTMLAAFTRAIGLFPPGRFVRLSDRRLARVNAAGATVDRPTVRTFPEGELLDLGHEEHARLRVVDLLDEQMALNELHLGRVFRADEEVDDEDEDVAPRTIPLSGATCDTESTVGQDGDESRTVAELNGPILPTDCSHGDGCRLC